MTPTYQTASISCPSCSHQFATPVLTLIDAGQSPEIKALFLSGRVNIAVCPQCGHAGQLSTPLVYHDPEKELLLTYVPSELGLGNFEEQRVIGDMTNRVMSTLPPERRKGYLFNPRSFLRIDGMIQAILEADGVTPEMLEAQRQKASLLERLVATSAAEARRTIVDENSQVVDLGFFELLELNIEAAHANEREDIANQLLGLRSELLEWTSVGRDIAVREEALRELGSEISRESLLEKLVKAAVAGESVKVETLVTFGRPAIDYIFYQQLTGQIEAAENSGNDAAVQTLANLRQTILELTAEIDAQLKQATEDASQLVQEIAQSEDLERAVRSHAADLDDLFLNALAMNLQAAEQANKPGEVERLRRIAEITMELLQEGQPPELQLINNLLRAEYPDGTRELLESNRDRIDPQFLEIMRMVTEDLAGSGREQLAERLTLVRQQVSTLLGQAAEPGV